MNRKQLTLLVVLGLLLGGLALYFNNNRQAEFSARDAGVGEKLLGEFPANDVTQVTIKTRDGEVNVAKSGDQGWTVKERANYPASFSEVAELVRKLWELKPVQSQKVGASQWSRLELAAPDAKDAGTNTATLVDLKGKDGKTIRSVLLGKKQMRESGGQFGGFPVGRWIALPDNKETVFVVSETFNEIEPKPESWLNKDFFKVEKLKSISFTSTNDTHSWSLVRTNESGEWSMVDKKDEEDLDKGKLSSFNWAFSSPSFNDVYAKDAEPVKDAFATPSKIALETFEGFRYDLQVGTQPDGESFYLTVATAAELPKERTAPADEKAEDKEKNEKTWKEAQDKLKEKLKKEQALNGWVYKVSKWTVDSVLKDRSSLMAEKKAASTNGTPAEIVPPPLPPTGGLDPVPPLKLPQ